MLGVNDYLSGNIESGESSQSLWRAENDDQCLSGSSSVKSGFTDSSCARTIKDDRTDIVRNNGEHFNSSVPSSVHGTLDSPSPWTARVCKILPEANNILLAVCLGRWDHIMGPQTIRAWLQEKTKEIHYNPSSAAHHRSVNSVRCEFGADPAHNVPGTFFVPSEGDMFNCKWEDQNVTDSADSVLMNAVKYVTNHTVNCLTVSSSFGTNNSASHEKGTSFFAVPDMNFVFLSLLFEVEEEKSPVPYSFAVIVSYEHYIYFLKLRDLCLQWLRRIAFRFHVAYVKNQLSLDITIWKRLNLWLVEFCEVLVELKTSGLMETPVTLVGDILSIDVLGRALTSHLQTFGSSVIIGSSAPEINGVISFLSLFLEESEKHASCLISPPKKYAFHMGLKLQGLLSDEFGGRDLASLELTSNPVPITVVDLKLGNVPSAVKQSAKFKNYLTSDYETYRQEFKLVEGAGYSGDHETVMHSVRDSGKLVDELIQELRLLPVKHWETHIRVFRNRIQHLALTLLSMVSWLRRTNATGGLVKFPGDTKGGIKLSKYLRDSLKLAEADFLVVLARAEKSKPGTYVHVMEANGQ